MLASAFAVVIGSRWATWMIPEDTRSRVVPSAAVFSATSRS